MSIREDSGVPFEICHEQQHLRLLELPPALLEQIAFNHLSNLTLKSIVPSSSSQTPANAVLCTDNQTYQVRQVHSSNSVYVLKPCETSLGYDSMPTEGLSAIAQCTTTLELIPAPSSATIFLKQTLPVYSGLESCTQSSTASTPLGKRNKRAVFEDAPFSLGEFEKACEDLCVFEVDGQAWLPTVSALANLWKSTMSGAKMRDVNLGESFSIATLCGIVEEDGHPIALLKAMIDRLSSNNSDLVDDDIALSKEKAVRWVGLVLLQSYPPSAEGILLSEFLENWQNQVQEDWRAHASLDALKGNYSQPGNGRIIFDESEGSAIISSIPAGSGGNNARKWHERFKNARR
ncbi:hypothetical protein N7G274_003107 [Stereocaulon virgatum]|uniref:Sister chromatid cohesion protein Dcc1 n=1 Tax=Stereocaulon virgatum TaxID=373712 RepID=A0ABR4AID4_9LECA